MPGKHARLSPSSASRWMNCPGSVKHYDANGRETTKGAAYTQEGTRAHALAEITLKRLMGSISYAEYLECRSAINPDAEMTRAVDYYKDRVKDFLSDAGGDCRLLVEQRVSLEDIVPECYGTSDAVIISKERITVIDFKYGKGIRVSAKENPQLRIYGAGALLQYGTDETKTVKMAIVQPRLKTVDTEEMPAGKLMEWVEREIRPAAERILSGDCRREAGNWCQFCEENVLCRARAKYYLDIRDILDRQTDSLTAEEIADVLDRARGMKAWIEKLEEFAGEALLNGEELPGLKLTEGKGRRKIVNTKAAAEALLLAGFDEDVIYKDREMHGITDLEKALGEETVKEIIGDYIEVKKGKPAVTRADDKRPEHKREGFER